MTIYDVVAYWRSPHGRDEDGEPDHCGTFDTLEEAQDYPRSQGFRWDLRGWQKGNWCAGIYPTRREEK